MNRRNTGTIAASFAVALTALLFAFGSATPAAAFSFGGKKKAPVAEAPPPEPEIPVGPPVLARYVVDTASAYASYMQIASGISSRFADGPSVSSALLVGAHSEQHQLQQGVVAYAAIVALQDPTFVAAVRAFAAHASQRDAMVRYILADPNYVTTMAGHESAAGLIVAALNSQGVRLKTVGDQVKQAAYDVQRQGQWSKKPVPNPDIRLQQVKQLSSAPLVAPDDLRAQMQQASSGAAPMVVSGQPLQAPYTQAVTRGMALAALAILGKAGDTDMAYVMPMLINDGDGYCFSMSKLNLYQCLSVARPYYEDVFCLGVHSLGDTGRCVMSTTGSADPVLPTTSPLIAAAGGTGGAATVATSTLVRAPVNQ